MLCEECGQRNATVLINTEINGHSETKHLCSKCASKLGIMQFGDLDNIFSGFFGGVQKAFSPQTLVCPECGYHLDMLNNNGYLGCDKCYDAFEAQLMPFVRKLQGSTEHKEESFGKPEKGGTNDIAALKKELAEAVSKEEYEKAAQLRDAIKQLENAKGTDKHE